MKTMVMVTFFRKLRVNVLLNIYTMLAKVHTLTVLGMQCEKVEVEVHVLNGIQKYNIVGLGDTAVQEAKERVRSAIKSSLFRFPGTRITINLAPAEIRKNGTMYDLPMAIGLLLATGQIDCDIDLSKTLFVGELALDGRLRHVHGILAMMMYAKEQGFEKIVLPKVNAEEASLIEGVEIIAAETLLEIVDHFEGRKTIQATPVCCFENLLEQEKLALDFEQVKGQHFAKRALEIAAAGSHNVLLNGSPGSGKTLMARTFQTIIPQMTLDESIEVTKVYSIANKLPKDRSLITRRPFRSVHHTASGISIIGGGRIPMPGEISLAHKGVLFLDELPEFPSAVLEVLRQPLEDKKITVTRTNGSSEFPAHFSMIAAMNPCPCGYYNVPNSDKECTCSTHTVQRYQKKISGPLLDRVDLYVDVSPVKFDQLKNSKAEEASHSILTRVQQARNLQSKRFQNLPISSNAEMSNKEIKQHCEVPKEAQQLLDLAVKQMNLSARAYYRVLKIARTIADLAGRENLVVDDIAEALQYRKKEVE